MAASAAPPPLHSGLDYLVVLDLEAICDDPADSYRHEIVELPWLVFDLATNTPRDHKQIFIAPLWNANPNPPPDAVRGLGTDVVFADSLADAILHFDTYIYQSFVVTGKSFYLLTDGPWDLKDLLFVEAARKAVILAPYFRTYINLRADFQRCFPAAPPPTDRKTMFSYLNISTEPRASGLEECAALASVVQCLLQAGHVFSQPEFVSDYEWSTIPNRIPAVATPLASAVPVGGIIRLRGLPWTCIEQDIVEFLNGIAIVPAGIHFVRNAHGKATGEAFVQLDSAKGVSLALSRHKEMMGRRYIEVFKSSPVDMSNHLGRADARRYLNAAHIHSNKGHPSTSVMGQTPTQAYSSTASQSSQVSVGSSGVDYGPVSTFPPHAAIGMMSSANVASHNFSSGSSSLLSHSLGLSSRTVVDPASTIPLNHSSVIPAGAIGSSYIVKVVGLPKNTAADDLLPLFDDLEIVGTGIHIVTGGTNEIECTGEAYVELTSEAWAKKAITRSGATVTVATGINPGSPIPTVPVEIRRSSAAQLRAALAHQASAEEKVHEKQKDRGKRNGTAPKGTKGHKGSPVSTRYFLRIRNIDDKMRTEDVRKLFESFGTGDDDVKFIKGSAGNGNLPSGEKMQSKGRVARVTFRSKEARDTAMFSIEKGALGGQQVYLEDGGNDTRSHKPAIDKSPGGAADGSVEGGDRVVRMRGLPYTSTDEDIVQFFDGYTIAPGGISRGKDRHGRASGEAWVTFVSEEDAKNVVSTLDKAHMGSRYIELKF